jgi:hypothetical protein
MSMYIDSTFYYTTMLLTSYFTLDKNLYVVSMYMLQMNKLQHWQAVKITSMLISTVSNTAATDLFLAYFNFFKKRE